ncbi:hypothetical protein LTR95_007877 [Oleoguttula sp. CCFEE 5521]
MATQDPKKFYATWPGSTAQRVIPRVRRIDKHECKVSEFSEAVRNKTHRTPCVRYAGPRNVAEAVWTADTDICEHCSTAIRTQAQSRRCYEAWKRAVTVNDRAGLEIRGSNGVMGYGVWTGPSTTLVANQCVGEYLGQLRSERNSRGLAYNYPLKRGKAIIEGSRAANWTRFINSSCTPNLYVRSGTVGKRNVITIRTRGVVQPNTELTSAVSSASVERQLRRIPP